MKLGLSFVFELGICGIRLSCFYSSRMINFVKVYVPYCSVYKSAFFAIVG